MKRSLSFTTVSLLILALGLFALLFADLSISHTQPGTVLKHIAMGLLTPQVDDVALLLDALLKTVAFAVLGVVSGAVVGFALTFIFQWQIVQWSCAFIRAIHEIFWALIFLQIFGLHPLTGILALALPYAATFAKVYAEILDESDPASLSSLPRNSSRISQFFYARLPDAWVHLKAYTLYRFECGLRSSTVLGFIGLPTLGYYLESSFMQGQYSAMGAVLLVFYLLIASLRYWFHPRWILVYIGIGIYLLSGTGQDINWQNVSRFFSEDIVPHPLRTGAGWEQTWRWLTQLMTQQAIPGIVHTLVLSQVALMATGIISLLLFPLITKHFVGWFGSGVGHGLLVILRSTPEYILAFLFLLIWGPSMLPAIVALTLHNAAIIAHLLGGYASELSLRKGSATGLNLYAYDILPRSYGQFMAYFFYRWEVIMRETAILGVLGIATLGFYVDSALQELRFDRAMVLIVITALLNIMVDVFARYLRGRVQPRSLSEN